MRPLIVPVFDEFLMSLEHPCFLVVGLMEGFDRARYSSQALLGFLSCLWLVGSSSLRPAVFVCALIAHASTHMQGELVITELFS